MSYYQYIYKIVRLLAFMTLTYLILTYTPSISLTNIDLYKMISLLTIAFIMIDTYYPNIYYD